MRLQHLTPFLLVGAALAAPPPFVLQGSQQLNLPANEAELPHLTSDQFLDIERAKVKAEQVMQSLVDRLEQAATEMEEDVAQRVQEEIEAASGGAADDAAGLPPHRPPPVLDFSDYTILEILNASLHHHPEHDHKADVDAAELPKWKLPWSPKQPQHHPGGGEHEHDPKYLPLHRLGWFVNQSEEAQKVLGKDDITLLAPDDFALRPPHKKHGPPRRDGEEEEGPTSAELEHFAAMALEEQEHQPIPHPFHLIAKSGKKCKKMQQKLKASGDKDEEERKKLFAKIIAHVLEYHTLPEIRTERSLVDSSTVATTHDSERIKVEPTLNVFPHPHPSLKFNGYARKRGPTIIAKNGLIHLIGAPLLPPLTPVNQLFLFPSVFSTLTSGLQKVDLASKLLPEFEGHDEASSPDLTSALSEETESMVQSVIEELLKEHKELGSYTVFAPGNWAFNKLGPKILAFLHSPFSLSRHALKYVLAYHIVPDIEFFTDFVHNDTKNDAFVVKKEVDVEVPYGWIVDAQAPPPPAEHPLFGKFPSASSPPPHSDHPPPSHLKANLTHYRLPTLLSTSGENANATLRVVVIEHRQWGHGPLQRSVVVLPHAPPPCHGGEKEKEKFEGEEHKRPGPHPSPVKVFKTDLPARHGAIQWIESLLLPPFPHHNDDDDLAPTGSGNNKHSNKRMRKALAELFA